MDTFLFSDKQATLWRTATQWLSLALLPSAVLAYSCSPASGGAQAINVNFTQSLNNASANTLYPGIKTNWLKDYSLRASCDACPIRTTVSYRQYYETVMNSRLTNRETRTVDGKAVNFYRLPDIDAVKIAAELHIPGGTNYVAVPFSSQAEDGSGHDVKWCNPGVALSSHFSVGRTGKIHLLLTQPFVGSLSIPLTKLFDIHGRIDSANYSPQRGKAIATVSLSGTVTVPQNCQLTAGQITTFDFGALSPQQLARPGEPGQHAIQRRFTIQCTNPAAGKIELSLESASPPAAPHYLI
ncbi:hypothetical protein HA052_10715, partial [Chromobacterium haemolyticum]